jgi:hypothetical protein
MAESVVNLLHNGIVIPYKFYGIKVLCVMLSKINCIDPVDMYALPWEGESALFLLCQPCNTAIN